MALGQHIKDIMKQSFADKRAADDLVTAIDANTSDAANIVNLGGVLLATQVEIDRATDISAREVVTTAATIAVTLTAHGERTVVLNSTHTQTATLPASSGGGAKYRFVVGTLGTDGSKVIKVANVTDIIQGFSHIVQTDVTQVSGFGTTATDDTVTLNNTTKGGFVGDEITFEDIASGVFQVKILGRASGTVVTPFSAGV